MTAGPPRGRYGSLAGRHAVVTGSSSGVGLATAELLTEQGVVVTGVDKAPGPLTTVTADLSDATEVDEVVHAVHDAVASAGLSILVNNAAVGVFDAPIQRAGLDVYDAVMAINARSVYALTHALADVMSAAPGPVVVNVASAHAIATARGVAAYAASKGAVTALTRAAALDLAELGIRVVAVLPGPVETPMLEAQARSEGRSFEELGFSRDPKVPGRLLSPGEIADVIVFLSSDAASGITGASISVDAGLLAGYSS